MKPAAGAFGQPEMGGPSIGPSASDPAAFLEQLKGLGLLNPGPSIGPQMGGPPPQPARTSVERSPASLFAPPPGMGPVGASPPGMGPLPPMDMPSRPVKKARFVPGKPGQPASGMTAHQMLKDPEVVETLANKIAEWEATNPKRALMGSHIQQMLPEVSASQARTIKRMLDKARSTHVTGDMEGLMQQGAAQALKGEL